jgi:hypothetical protein
MTKALSISTGTLHSMFWMKISKNLSPRLWVKWLWLSNFAQYAEACKSPCIVSYLLLIGQIYMNWSMSFAISRFWPFTIPIPYSWMGLGIHNDSFVNFVLYPKWWWFTRRLSQIWLHTKHERNIFKTYFYKLEPWIKFWQTYLNACYWKSPKKTHDFSNF